MSDQPPRNDGDLAFPVIGLVLGGPTGVAERVFDRGMSLRDYFAAQALMGIVSADDPIKAEGVAPLAWDLAEMMIAEREKRYPKS